MASQKPKFLEDQINAKGVRYGIYITVALIVLVFGSFALMGGFLFGLNGLFKKMIPAPPELSQVAVMPPEPRLQVNPRQDIAEKFSRENLQLNSYGWVDQKAGMVRIPIDRAMQMIVDSQGRSSQGVQP